MEHICQYYGTTQETVLIDTLYKKVSLKLIKTFTQSICPGCQSTRDATLFITKTDGIRSRDFTTQDQAMEWFDYWFV